MFRSRFEEPQATIARAWEELQAKQRANMQAWGLGNTDRWDADLERGTIKFSNRDGFVVSAPVQVIGTYDTEDGTWFWGWDHPSVRPRLGHAARLACDFGHKYSLSQYVQRMIECSEEDAWRFTAVALHLSKGAGSYRGPSGLTYTYMTFGAVTIKQVH